MDVITTCGGEQQVSLNGHLYVKGKANKSTRIRWICNKSADLNCKGAVTTSLQIDDGRETVPHCHPPDRSAVEAALVATRTRPAVRNNSCRRSNQVRLIDWLIDWFTSVSVWWRLYGRSVTDPTPTNGHRFTALSLPWWSPIQVLTGVRSGDCIWT